MAALGNVIIVCAVGFVLFADPSLMVPNAQPLPNGHLDVNHIHDLCVEVRSEKLRLAWMAGQKG